MTNPYHEPAGDPEGGQFAHGPGGDATVNAARKAAGLRKYVPSDSSKYTNVGEYADALPKYNKELKGPGGQYIEVWKDYSSNNWVVQELDVMGNEIKNVYVYRKQQAVREAAMMQNDWYK